MSIISNTTVISNFAATDQLELLRRLFGSLYLSTPVYDEIQDGLEEGYLFYSGTFLTDDNAARRESQKRGVRVSGTIGCLVLGVERHLMGNEEADRLLAEMIRMGYRSPVSGLHGLVRPLGK